MANKNSYEKLGPEECPSCFTSLKGARCPSCGSEFGKNLVAKNKARKRDVNLFREELKGMPKAYELNALINKLPVNFKKRKT